MASNHIGRCGEDCQKLDDLAGKKIECGSGRGKMRGIVTEVNGEERTLTLDGGQVVSADQVRVC